MLFNLNLRKRLEECEACGVVFNTLGASTTGPEVSGNRVEVGAELTGDVYRLDVHRTERFKLPGVEGATIKRHESKASEADRALDHSHAIGSNVS